ncbi:hypothetical protein CPT_Pollock81 [Escherichia phage Pollock]|uniref:Uncharacterized protein n=1 Tax=Escherichia phage Pollock TaxID=1540097 RepID=A0A0A0YWB7_9CAUD|nr:hypothetical protein ACQ44_gp85 [Escherichia phage Pollock]AIX12440.1 hypothetical protein CPT_Pollock81 [Escherichia phage Pollock]
MLTGLAYQIQHCCRSALTVVATLQHRRPKLFLPCFLGIALQTGISCICIKGVKTGDTRVLELCYQTQGVIGLTNPTSYQ